jgi:hypothetical protein
MKDKITEFNIDKISENEYCDKFKRKLTIQWKEKKYFTNINSDYLENKIISLDNLEEFFDAVFNNKKFYDIDIEYNFYFCGANSIQLNIWFEIKINNKLKPLKQDYIFILHIEDNKSWFQYFTDIILDRD